MEKPPPLLNEKGKWNDSLLSQRMFKESGSAQLSSKGTATRWNVSRNKKKKLRFALERKGAEMEERGKEEKFAEKLSINWKFLNRDMSEEQWCLQGASGCLHCSKGTPHSPPQIFGHTHTNAFCDVSIKENTWNSYLGQCGADKETLGETVRRLQRENNWMEACT